MCPYSLFRDTSSLLFKAPSTFHTQIRTHSRTHPGSHLLIQVTGDLSASSPAPSLVSYTSARSHFPKPIFLKSLSVLLIWIPDPNLGSWDFPGHPVVSTLCFHCREHEFYPWLGNRGSTCWALQPKKKRMSYSTMMLTSNVYKELIKTEFFINNSVTKLCSLKGCIYMCALR